MSARTKVLFLLLVTLCFVNSLFAQGGAVGTILGQSPTALGPWLPMPM